MARFRLFLRLAIGVSLASGLTRPVAAQDFSPVITPDVITGIGVTQAGKQAAERRARRSASPASLSAPLSSQFAAAPAKTAGVTLPYRPSPQVRAKVVQIFYANGPKSAAYANEVKQFVESGMVFRDYARVAPPFGLRTNDAVDAYAFYLLAQWSVANDHRPDPTPAQVAGVRAQASRALASAAASLGSDALRQEFAEVLIAQGILMAHAHAFNVRHGNEDVVRTLAAAARNGGVRVFNTDPTRLALTPAGFRPKR